MIDYKGFIGTVEFDAEAHIFHGEVVNTRDVITFQGKSVKEIEKAFKDSVQDYLGWCKDEGVEPEKPYSGKFNLRLAPEIHRQAALTARKMHISLNRFVEKAVIDEIKRS